MTTQQYNKMNTLVLSVSILFLFGTSFAQAALKEGGQKERMNRLKIEKTFEEPAPTAKTQVLKEYGKLPLTFIQNDGQMDDEVKFYERGKGHTTFFTKEGMTLVLSRSQQSAVSSNDERLKTGGQGKGLKKSSEVIRLIPLGTNKNPEIIAEGKQEGTVNYFIGNDPAKWKTRIPTYHSVLYKALYPNIDLRFYGNNRQFEYDVIVKPGADPSTVRFAYEGIEGLRVTKEGALEIALKEGKLVQKKPYVYQEIDGKRVEVEGKFVLNSNPQNKTPFSYGFEVASYNKNFPLTIDPVLVYSTYLEAETGKSDYGLDIAVDNLGNAYITGVTSSVDFNGTRLGASDAFVTKINAAGTALVYSTYLGGSQDEIGYGITVDGSGNAYITGLTLSDDFPTSFPIQGSHAGGSDAFVVKINTTGTAFIYSTFLGGSRDDIGFSIAVDGSNNAYVSGGTDSTDFPTVNPIQGSNAGGNFPPDRLPDDAFVTKINASGTAFIYSTYLGGDGNDGGVNSSVLLRQGNVGPRIAVDGSGNAYIVGWTSSSNFPTSSPTILAGPGGSGDIFIIKVNAAGTAFVYSTTLGGSRAEAGYDIAVDGAGNAYITGWTDSTDFPTMAPIQGTLQFGRFFAVDAFVTKINPTGTALIYSTYLGGIDNDTGYSIAVDNIGNAYVTGSTTSIDFPTKFPIQESFISSGRTSGWDAFVTKINATGTEFSYSTNLGGRNNDFGRGIAVDDRGNAYVTGWTASPDFPLIASPRPVPVVNKDTPFISKISNAAAIPDITVTNPVVPFGNVTVGGTSDHTVTIANNGNANLVIGAIASANGLASPFSLIVGQDNCSNQTLAASATCTFIVRFAPSAAIVSNDSFDIPSNDTDEDPVTVSVSGTGVVIPVPDISVTPLNHSFGNVTSGTTSNKTFSINNTGNGDLVIGTIAQANGLLSPFRLVVAQDNCSNQTLTVSSSCTFVVEFAPGTATDSNDTFDIPSDDIDENPLTINVSGAGVSGTVNQPPTVPALVFPDNGGIESAPDVAFGWNRSTDLDGDAAITYTLRVCENANLTLGCLTTEVLAAVKNKEIDYAELMLGSGLVFGFVMVGRSKGRKKVGMLMAALWVSAFLLTACGGGGGGGPSPATSDLSQIVTGLKSGTAYFWKVTADDGNGGTSESETRRFTTG